MAMRWIGTSIVLFAGISLATCQGWTNTSTVDQLSSSTMTWNVTSTARFNDQGTNYPVRLVNGNRTGVGRVEIYVQDHGGWGIVCDDFWDIQDAHVVCRQLGFSGALQAVRNSLYGYGNGQHRMDDVACTGSESYLDRCPHSGWNNENCGNSEAAGVVCDNSSRTTTNHGATTSYEYTTQTSSTIDGTTTYPHATASYEYTTQTPWTNDGTTDNRNARTSYEYTTETPWTNDGVNITNVRCNSSYLEIEVTASDGFPSHLLANATLANASCGPDIVGPRTAVLKSKLDACSTRRVETSLAISYYNELRILQPDVTGRVVNRNKNIKIPFVCILPRNAQGSSSYRLGDESSTAPVVGHGEYTLELDFFTDSLYRQRVYSFPFYIKVDDPLYVLLQLVSTDKALKISPGSCWATPEEKSNNTMYYLIRNRCPVDPTVAIDLVNNDLNQYRFSLRSFEFVGRGAQVYIHCNAYVCDIQDNSYSCQRGCAQRTKRATDLKDSIDVALGPLIIKRPKDENPTSSGAAHTLQALVWATAVVWVLLPGV